MEQMNRLLDHMANRSVIVEAKQLREIVPIEYWLENPYYCGEDGLQLYDFWKQELKDFFEADLNEWIMYGSLGSGKTTAAVFCIIRKIYEMSCYEDIPGLFGLMKSSILYFIYFSVSLKTARKTGYGKLLDVVDSIPYFQKVYKRDTDIESEARFSHQICTYGSDTGHQIGLDLFGTILDEGDFIDSGGGKPGAQMIPDFSKAKHLYESTLRRRKTRFSVQGKDSGISILASSPAYDSPFVESRIERTKKTHSAFITHATGLKVSPHKFSSECFFVFLGNEILDPKLILNKSELKEVYSSLHIELNEVEMSRTLGYILEKHKDEADYRMVPIDFLEDFEDDILKGIQDILGIPLRRTGGFVLDRDFDNAINLNYDHPFTKEIISLSTKRDDNIIDYFDPEMTLDKGLARYIHIDQSVTTDRTGLACSLVGACGIGQEPEDFITTEWMLAVSPPSVGEIPILRVAEFCVNLRDLGYNIALVTMDSYQSRASLQYLEENGIDCAMVSVDRTDEAYVDLRRLIINKRYFCYDYSIFRGELVNLVWDKGRRKVDHKANGSKDVADAVAGSVQSARLYGQGQLSLFADELQDKKTGLLRDDPDALMSDNEEYWEELDDFDFD